VSEKGLEAIKKMINGGDVNQENSGMSAGEWREFTSMLEL